MEPLVEVDGRTIPENQWMRELTLRCAAWMAIVQAVIVGASAWWKVDFYSHFIEWWRLILCGALAIIGVLAVRSRPLRIALVSLALVAIAAVLVVLSHVRASYSSPGLAERAERSIPCLLYLAGGVLLLRGRPIGRDMLLVLSFVWTVRVVPWAWGWLVESRPDFGTFYDYGYRWEGPAEALVAVLPPLLVLLVTAARPGRSLLLTCGESGRLAPFSSMVRERSWVRLLIVYGLLVCTVAASIWKLETLLKLLRVRWY